MRMIHIAAAAAAGIAAAAIAPNELLGPRSVATTRQTPQSPRSPLPRGGARDTLRFVAHAEHVPAGFPSRAVPLEPRNPYEGNARAAAVGGQLFVAYNCIDCHGADGSGAMGPSLADGRWHFGGSPAEVFESIYQGRPDGMPAWGGRITDDQIWMLVSYVRSLSAGKEVSTENFTGRVVERTGH
ncbi:MAG: c-type cytochrome [Gemmatimonadaceae bacterium]